MSRKLGGTFFVTVKELMQQVDVSRVVDAFLLLDYGFSEDNYEHLGYTE